MIISVEGNIGSGKSTLVNLLKEQLKDDNRFIFIQEPVDLWLKNTDKNGESILTKFYNDQEKYAFAFQIMAYTNKLHLIHHAMHQNPGKIFIVERCVYTDRNVFAKMLYNDGKIEEIFYNIYNSVFDEFLNDTCIDKFIYVDTTSSICHNRIKKRQREGENLIASEYLEKIDKYHHEWLDNIDNILCLNGNDEFEKNTKVMNVWKDKILQFIMKKS
jgi:deoxyadenosine/deoxycytidine kinase